MHNKYYIPKIKQEIKPEATEVKIPDTCDHSPIPIEPYQSPSYVYRRNLWEKEQKE